MENNIEEKYIIAFVGLPARGKSYLSKKIAKYLNWIGYKSEVFSIGLYRRLLIGTNCDWKYFDDNNKESLYYREKCVQIVLDDMIKFLLEGGSVGIVDGTNTRSSRRRGIEDYIKQTFSNHPKIKYNLVWIETITTLEYVLEQNILKTKLKSPDYQNWDKEKAMEDFRERIKVYEKVYEHMSPEVDGTVTSFIKIKDRNTEVVVQNVKGFIQSKVLSYLLNLNAGEKAIYLTRHGESLHNIKKIIGGDSELSLLGLKYARALYTFISNESSIKKASTCHIYSSTLKRSIRTAEELKCLGRSYTYKCLDELHAGICDSMTYEEVKENHPHEYEERNKDKLNYRYPRGESYRDLINRIEPMIHEIERRDGPVIVVGHQATLRCIYGYFNNAPLEKIPTLDIPLHCVIKFVPEAYGFDEERFIIDPETHNVCKVEKEKIVTFVDTLYHIPERKEI